MDKYYLNDFLRRLAFVLACTLFFDVPVTAQEEDTTEHHPQMHHQKNLHKHEAMPPIDGHMQHDGGHMQHGMIAAGIDKFPTTAYNETRQVRPIERPLPPPDMMGDSNRGKILAYAANKGRCLTCHILGPEGEQAGNVGPNLSTYGKAGRDQTYTFQHIWDARAHNPKTMMPPFGTNELLTRQEVVDITAYLTTLIIPVTAPELPQAQDRNFDIAGEDFTLADIYIEQGEALFRRPGKNGASCAACHTSNGNKGPELKGVASTYPKYAAGLKRVIGLEQRINLCQTKYKHSEPYRLGSEPSNLVTSYVKFLSRRMPIKLTTDGPAAAALERGKTAFFQKTGQLNFSCADCHTTTGDKWLRGQPLSEIKPNGKYSYTATTWPKHFIAGHDLGLISLRQRIRHCQTVTRTYPLALHTQEYTDLELYLTSLAQGKPMLAPTKSRLRGSE